jgi:hypothetical protein
MVVKVNLYVEVEGNLNPDEVRILAQSASESFYRGLKDYQKWIDLGSSNGNVKRFRIIPFKRVGELMMKPPAAK